MWKAGTQPNPLALAKNVTINSIICVSKIILIKLRKEMKMGGDCTHFGCCQATGSSPLPAASSTPPSPTSTTSSATANATQTTLSAAEESIVAAITTTHQPPSHVSPSSSAAAAPTAETATAITPSDNPATPVV